MGKRHQFFAPLSVGYGEVEVSPAATTAATGEFTGEDANNRQAQPALELKWREELLLGLSNRRANAVDSG
jgi:hypothetical protein